MRISLFFTLALVGSIATAQVINFDDVNLILPGTGMVLTSVVFMSKRLLVSIIITMRSTLLGLVFLFLTFKTILLDHRAINMA